MRLAEDVLAIFDELRNTPGTLKRARIIGRLWSATRHLPAEERKELASILADRYAPKLADKLAQGRDIQSAELLKMIRTIRSVDADEITEIMEQIQDPEGRRALLSEVAESLEDDLEDADLGTLVDDPAARFAAVSEAAAELADDLELLPPEVAAHDPDQAPVHPQHGPDQSAPAALLDAEPEPAEAATDSEADGPGGDAAPAPDLDRGADAAPGSGPADFGEESGTSPSGPAAGPAEEASRPGSAATGASRQDGLDADGSPPPVPGEDGPDSYPAATPAVTPTELAAIVSPLLRLRVLSQLVTVPPPALAAELACAFPDGWQRRRAVAALCRSIPAEADVDDRLAVAAALVPILERESDRRWIRRSLEHMWSLTETEVRRLDPTTSRTGATVTSSR